MCVRGLLENVWTKTVVRDVNMKKENDLREVCKALGQAHSIEIIAYLRDHKDAYVKEMAKELGVPYTTAQKRIIDLERAGLVESRRGISKANYKAVKRAKVTNFKHLLTPLSLKEYIETDLEYYRRTRKVRT